MTSSQQIPSTEPHFQVMSHSEISGFRAAIYVFLGNTIQPFHGRDALMIDMLALVWIGLFSVYSWDCPLNLKETRRRYCFCLILLFKEEKGHRWSRFRGVDGGALAHNNHTEPSPLIPDPPLLISCSHTGKGRRLEKHRPSLSGA